MDLQVRITQVKRVARSDKEAITMLLSACADMGSASGVLLSVSKFNEAAELILGYLEQGLMSDKVARGCCEHMAEDGHFCTHIGDVVQ